MMGEGGESANVRSIVVRFPNWLGDVVMSTPGLRALRTAYPKARITALLPPALVPVLDGSPFVDEVWGLASRGSESRAGWWRDVRRIRAAHFDLGLAIPESISSAWLLRAGGVRSVVGFSRDPLRRWLLHRALPAPKAWGRRRLVSKEKFVLALTAGVGASGEDCSLALSVSDEENARFDRSYERIVAEQSLEEEAGLSRLSDAIVLAPGAGFGAAKCWPAEAYAELGDRIMLGGTPVVLLGAPGEAALIRAVRETMSTLPLVIDGVLDVGQVKVLMSRVGGLAANDAGARHLAAAFDVPSVIFFGPTSVAKTPDNLARVEILETEHECRPCYRRECPIDHRCLRSISVDDAENAVLRLRGTTSVSDV